MVPSLQSLALLICRHFPESIIVERGEDDHQEVFLKGYAFFPSSICDLLCEVIVDTRPLYNLVAFTDRKRCQLKKLNLSDRKLKPYQKLVTDLLDHKLEIINFSNAYLESEIADKMALSCGNCLRVLTLSGTTGSWKSKGGLFLRELQSLKKLDVSCVMSPFGKCIESIAFMKSLVWLDLSSTLVQGIVPLTDLSK